ncbi:MAG: DUF4301 family protein [Alphaproteobacteria bacterium]|nr:DUF4301 family protein [Alphaproteobacteria bacterium]
MDFSEKDLKQIAEHGLTVEKVNQQLEDFKNGFPFIDIIKPATTYDGVIKDDGIVYDYMATQYSNYAKTHKIVKFVPASGAATRMFKDLMAGETDITSKVINNIEQFAFWNDLQTVLPKNPTTKDIVENIISRYGNTPKGLIPFHEYGNYARTPVEEHLMEGVQYAASGNTVHIHFTVSPEHRMAFESLLNRIVPIYELKYCVKYDVQISEQNKSTDTIAVDMNNTPFRNIDGSLLFRPAGHGALIENLNNIDADLIFIKNIDNITTDDLRKDTIRYKKILAGILIYVQQTIFDLIHKIDSEKANCELLTQILHNFVTTKLGIKLSNNLSMSEYRKILNRPIRVCGMVKNTGDPGGGPFWVRGADGDISLQIVESSQIAPESKDIMNKSEYFNPVDLVCGIRDFNNEKFDLTKYVDKNTGFISNKSKDGKDLRAMERPGLWNGAMANWNTIFVEVPGSTFTPVKVVTDLLSKEHKTRYFKKIKSTLDF